MALPRFDLIGTIKEPDPFYELYTGKPERGCIGISSLKQFLSDNSNASDVEVVINSNGGDAQMGLDMHDLLVASGKIIHTRVEGVCYSAATPSLLAAPAANRSMLENSSIGIHLPYIPPYTLADSYTADELQSLADGMRVFEDLYIKLYADTTSKSATELRDMMTKETIMSADMAVENGFVSQIIKTNIVNLSQLKAVAFISNKIKVENNKNSNIMKKFLLTNLPAVAAFFNLKVEDEIEIDNEKLEKIEAEMKLRSEKITTLSAELATAKSSIDILVNEKAVLDAAKIAADAKIADFATIQDELATVKAEFTTLKAEVETFKSNFTPQQRQQQQQNDASYNARKAEAESHLKSKDKK